MKTSRSNPFSAVVTDYELFLETLEDRIAPATLLADGKTVTYNDADGDLVTVKFKQAVPAGTNIADILKFTNADTSTNFNFAGGQTLDTVDLTAWNFAAGQAIKFTVEVSTKQAGAGDGKTDVGYVNATGLNIKSVKISGDLTQINAGTGLAGVKAVNTLEVGSFGVHGIPATSTLNGGVDLLKIHGDLEDSVINVTGSVSKVEIEGAVKTAVGNTNANAGQLNISETATTLNIAGGVQGGDGADSGKVTVKGVTGLLTTGTVSGGVGNGSGQITIGTGGCANILNGGIEAGTGTGSGKITINGAVKKATVKGNISADPSSGDGSGQIDFNGTVGSFTAVNITGGGGLESGSAIFAMGAKSVKITENVTGGGGDNSGTVNSDASIGTFFANCVVGGAGQFSGGVNVAKGDFTGDGVDDMVSKFTVQTNLIGGVGDDSGVVNIQTSLKTFLGGTIFGGSGLRSGGVTVAAGDVNGDGFADPLSSAKITGNLTGGTGNDSGVFSASSTYADFYAKTVTILGSLNGGDGDRSGVFNAENVNSFKVLQINGGEGDDSGGAIFDGNVGTIAVKLDLWNNSFPAGPGSAFIEVQGDAKSIGLGAMSGSAAADSGVVDVDGNLDKFSVKYYQHGGAGMGSGAVLVGGILGSYTNGGDATGIIASDTFIKSISIKKDAGTNPFSSRPLIIMAPGSMVPGFEDVAFDKISIGGNVTNTDILGGYDSNGAAVNGDAIINSFSLGGSFSNSDLVAGVDDVDASGFGSATNTMIGGTGTGTIKKVDIKGSASASSTTHGIVANQFLSVKIDGNSIDISDSAGNPLFQAGTLVVNKVD